MNVRAGHVSSSPFLHELNIKMMGIAIDPARMDTEKKDTANEE